MSFFRSPPSRLKWRFVVAAGEQVWSKSKTENSSPLSPFFLARTRIFSAPPRQLLKVTYHRLSRFPTFSPYQSIHVGAVFAHKTFTLYSEICETMTFIVPSCVKIQDKLFLSVADRTAGNVRARISARGISKGFRTIIFLGTKCFRRWNAILYFCQVRIDTAEFFLVPFRVVVSKKLGHFDPDHLSDNVKHLQRLRALFYWRINVFFALWKVEFTFQRFQWNPNRHSGSNWPSISMPWTKWRKYWLTHTEVWVPDIPVWSTCNPPCPHYIATMSVSTIHLTYLSDFLAISISVWKCQRLKGRAYTKMVRIVEHLWETCLLTWERVETCLILVYKWVKQGVSKFRR